MSLFPAYASDASDSLKNLNESSSEDDGAVISAALESRLLASDEEPPPAAPAPPAPAPPTAYFRDTQRDCANLRVSTLYYPGRPEYRAVKESRALGAQRAERRRRSARRYWHAGGAAPPDAAAAAAARGAVLRAALAASPADEELLLQHVAFQAEWGAAGAELRAAEEAVARAESAATRAALHRARARQLAPHQLRAALRADAAAERRAPVRLELRLRLLEEEGGSPRDALAACPSGAVRVLYAHGCQLRAAGLWERLVLTMELAAAVNFPPAAAFPPPPDRAADERRERAAAALEDEACRSGLPLSAVWARVERARAAAHWRPGGGGGADPQRAPPAADAADAVRAAAGPGAAAALAAALLRLAKVPLLPAGEYAARRAGAEPRAGEPAIAETLAALLRAARRLPPAHPARPATPAAARAALAPLLDPPHYFTDAHGYLAWTNALWEACCGWMEGERRVAFACWRLRWLHALALLAEPAEARRLRGEARAALRRHAPAAPAAAAHYARLEAAVSGAAAGRRAALRAARAALGGAAPETALFAARVAGELDPSGAAPSWALCCAALGLALPPDEQLGASPPPELRAAALSACEARCSALEREWAAGDAADEEGDGDVCSALLPGAGEWAAARAALADSPERARLLARLLADRRLFEGGAALQYGEQAAAALVLRAVGAARARAARALLPLFPRNALLALVCAGAPLWAEAPAPPPSERAGLALLLPLLLRAPLATGAAPGDAARLAARCGRLAREGAAGALSAAARLEAEARAPRPRPARALFAALAEHAAHKWLYVRGAAWCGADAAALADALLERGLRAHALLDELRAPDPHPQ